MIDRLWGTNARVSLLLIVSALILFCGLGGRELWTQEWRWADICWYMTYSGDYLHPLLGGLAYYDKPLLSYWLMIFFSYLTGGLNEWALRMPSVLAGLLAVWSIYRIGLTILNRQAGLVAGWMLVTTYFFIFWARTANADMLNLAGILFALQWYFEHRERRNFLSFTVFFLILGVTGLFKGLIGIVVPLIAIFPDLVRDKNWKKYLKPSLFLAVLPALFIYLLPFWASTHFGGKSYAENGLMLVYRENILRYFSPFDHTGPIYTYLIYLPVYLLPWTIFFIPALVALKKRWAEMSAGSRWTAWSTLLIFLFLTLSGSRRNYYVLPLVPFAILMTTDWLISGITTKKLYSKQLDFQRGAEERAPGVYKKVHEDASDESNKAENSSAKSIQWAKIILIVAFIAEFLIFGIIQPLYYTGGGIRPFAKEVQAAAVAKQPWSQWNIVFLDARTKVEHYLNPVHPVKILNGPIKRKRNDDMRDTLTKEQLVAAWPILLNPPSNTIFITSEVYREKLQGYFKNYQMITAPLSLGEKVLSEGDPNRPVAFLR